MAEGKKSFVLYTDYVHTVCKLTDAKAGKLFKHILKFVNDENPVAEDQIIELVFEPIKQNLKRDLKDWEDEKQKRSEAGKKGMETRWRHNNVKTVITIPNTVKQPITTITDNVNVNVNVIVFINIGSEKFLMKPSEVAVSESFISRTETTLMTSLKGIDAAILWERFDKEYTCHDFTDRNHFYNSLKKTGKEILNPPVSGYKTSLTPKHIDEIKPPVS